MDYNQPGNECVYLKTRESSEVSAKLWDVTPALRITVAFFVNNIMMREANRITNITSSFVKYLSSH